jgi:outer membrane protein
MHYIKVQPLIKILIVFFLFINAYFLYSNEKVFQFSIDDIPAFLKKKNKDYLQQQFNMNSYKSIIKKVNSDSKLKLQLGMTSADKKINEGINSEDIYTQLIASYMFFKNNNFKNEINEATTDYLNSEIQTNIILINLILESRLLYWQLLKLKEILELYKEKIKYLHELLKLIIDRNQIGITSNFEIEWINLQCNIAETDYIKVQNEFNNKTLYLKNMIGMEKDKNIDLTTEFENLNIIVKNFNENSIKDIFSIKLIENEIIRANNKLNYISKTKQPYIKIFLKQVDNNGHSVIFNFDSDWTAYLTGNTVMDPISTKDMKDYLLGFSLSYNIDDGGYKQADTEYEKNILNSRKLELEQEKETIYLKINQDINNVNSNLYAFKLMSEYKKIWNKNIEFVKLKYISGQYNLKNVLDAYIDYIDIKTQYIDTIYQYNIACEQFKFDSFDIEYQNYLKKE